VPGFALIFSRDGAPVSAPRLERMAERLAYRGRGVATWVEGPIGLAQVGARTDGARAVVEASADGSWRMVFDGRLDNRTDLARELALPAVAADGSDDARIALCACERWGPEAPARMLGDFAGAAWHARAREVWLFRDVRALRPLYFRLTDRELASASDLRTLTADSPAPINEGMVAECLTFAPTSHRETLHRGISRLPMAHAAVVSATTAREWQYWIPEPDDRVAALGDDDRSARLTALLGDALDARLSGSPRIALLLSGGLDSSTLAALLAERPGVAWRSFTMGHARRDDDEREYAALVARHLGAPHTVVESRVAQPSDLRAAIDLTADLPPPPNGVHGIQLRERVGAEGYHVALSGLGSDEWLTGSYLAYADQARSGSFLQLARAVWADRTRDESTRVRLQLAGWALCPPIVKHAVRRVLRRTLVPPWIAAGFARRTALHDRLRATEIAIPDFDRLSQRAAYGEVTAGSYVYLLEMQERAGAHAGVEERYPFHDRRLNEFSLALPESDLWGPGHSKAILRRAMAGRLPADVTGRHTSPNADLVLHDMLRALGGQAFFHRLAIAEAGWVEPSYGCALWARTEEQAAAGRASSRDLWSLWAIAAMELWAQSSPGGSRRVA
jgi:asparagine synthase (glutamine-hydrolysing)